MPFRNAARLRAALAVLLAMLLASAAGAQDSSKLMLKLAPLGAAAKDRMIPVTAVVGMDVIVKNESSEPVSHVVLRAKLNGVKLLPENGWKADGDDALLEIAAIKPNEEVIRRLQVRVDMAPLPPGRQAEVVVEAKAGATSASAATKFPIGDCAAAFQAELTRIRIGPLAEIWPTADDLRKPDTTLPRTRYFRVGFRRAELANLDRLAAGYQARLTADYEFFREGVRYTARRWSDELRAFTGQEPNPGLCAVNEQMFEGIRKTIGYVTARIEPPQKAYARAMDLLRKTVGAQDGDDLRSIALQVAEAAGAKIENPPAATFAVLERAKELLKDTKLSEAQLDHLSLVESVAWIEAQALRAKKLSDLIENTITGIAQARKKSCVCAF